MRNIDRFDEVTGLVFARLYDKFPVPTDITPSSLLDDIRSLDDSEDEYLEAFLFMASFIPATIHWLAEEGFIKFQHHVREDEFTGIVLTGKGLAALKATPKSLDSGRSFGEMLTSAARKGGGEALRFTVNKILSLGVDAL